MRWYFFTSKQPWDGYRFSLETIGEAVRQFLLQLWNTYAFYVLYANANDRPRRRPRDAALGPRPLGPVAPAARRSRPSASGWSDFDATVAGRAIQAFVDELSNWYVRRSRREFWDGSWAAFETLRTCLLTVAKLLAPFCPFIADEIYDNLDGAEPSVHLCDFPVAGERDLELEDAMAVARETVRLGLAARGQAKLKVRQPLRAAVVVATGAEREAIERLAELVRDELNVRELRFVSRGRRARRGRGQAQLPHARPAVRQADADRRGRGRRPGRGPRGVGAARRPVGINLGRRATTTSSTPTTCWSR